MSFALHAALGWLLAGIFLIGIAVFIAWLEATERPQFPPPKKDKENDNCGND